MMNTTKNIRTGAFSGSETSSTLQSRGIYHFPLTNRLLTYDDGQCSSLGNCTTNWGAKNADVVVSLPVTVITVWSVYLGGFDYIGEPTPYFTKIRISVRLTPPVSKGLTIITWLVDGL